MYSKTTDTTIGSNKDLSAIVRAGCFASEEEALCEAVQMLFAVKPHLRVEAAIRRYLDEEITLGRAFACRRSQSMNYLHKIKVKSKSFYRAHTSL